MNKYHGPKEALRNAYSSKNGKLRVSDDEYAEAQELAKFAEVAVTPLTPTEIDEITEAWGVTQCPPPLYSNGLSASLKGNRFFERRVGMKKL